MPKVTVEYLEDKRNYILECAGEILKEKPLYRVTVRDIIKKAGFSQGAIYRYYAGLDDIYADFINKHTGDDFLTQKLDALLVSGKAEKDIFAECFTLFGEYIETLMKSIAGKTFFELTVLYAYDAYKRDAIFPKLRFKQSLEYARHRIVEYALKNIERGVFKPRIPVPSVIMFVSGFVDGIAQSAAIHTPAGGGRDSESAMDIPEMFRLLSKAVLGFLEV